MREPQRAHVGLVRGIGPVALVLHLEGVAQHGADHAESRRHLVGERADVHDRLHRVYDLRKAGLDHPAVHLAHLHRVSADSLHPVQDDEPGAVGEEVGLGGPDAIETQRAVRAAGDARAVIEALSVAAAARGVGDGEASFGFLYLEIADLGVERAPDSIAHHVGDGADRLAPVVADVAQVAGIELRRQRPRPEQPGLRRRLAGAEEHDVTGRGFGHDESPCNGTG